MAFPVGSRVSIEGAGLNCATGGSPFANADGQVAYPNVDLTEEAIQQLVARYTFAANARVVTAYDQMVKSLLDISA